MPATTLRPNPSNARIHSRKQIRQIARSIAEFGWTNPLLIDEAGNVVAGHGRLEAAKLNGIDNVPIVRLANMTAAQMRAYAIADNRLAELAGWNSDLLRLEFQALIEIDPAFDLTLTGFEMGDIDIVLDGGNDEDDESPLPAIDPEVPAVTKPGDLWHLGPHRLLCGDATKAEFFDRLMGGESAQLVFTDPPYNVPIAGHVSGLGAVKHREFAMASGEMTVPEFTGFLRKALANIAARSEDGSIHFICMDWRHIGELLAAAGGPFRELKNICVWVKSNAGMGSLYRSQHEFVAVFKNGAAPHINNIELGRHGRHRTNIWRYGGLNTFGPGRDEALAQHPTVKPVAMVRDAILDCSHRNGIVLDPFVGSGTTLIAAERVGRRAYGLEIDPHYCDLALRRFQSMTGVEPVDGDGTPFSERESVQPRGVAGSRTHPSAVAKRSRRPADNEGTTIESAKAHRRDRRRGRI